MHRIGLLLTLPALLAAAQPATRDMTVVSPDGFILKGTLSIPSNPGLRPVVILAHQYGADRTGWRQLAEDLNVRGIATLALDLRGHGQSIRKGDALVTIVPEFQASSTTVGFDRIPGDLVQAAQWVRRQPRIDGRHVGLAGASLGAYCALVAAPQIRPVAVLALSPAGGWGEAPEQRLVQAAEATKAAVFVLASREDPAAYEAAAALKGVFGVHTRIVAGKEHGFDYLPALAETLGGWFGEYLGHHARVLPPKTEPMKIPTEEVK